MGLKDIISPFYVWKRALEKPFTHPSPLTTRPGSDRYRGFHQNDMHKCIGCGSCETICQNAAIDLVHVDGIETTEADSGLRPKIDYGRCCWCGLCVDICTTASLTMSNEYTWVDADPEVYRFIPGADEKSWNDTDKGYRRAEGYNLLETERVDMDMTLGDDGIKSFMEVIHGYTKEQAMAEAMRCVECGVCVATCPAHMDIPDYIKAIREDRLEDALELLYRTNPMPATCGRICTHRCETVCALGHQGDPVAIRWLKRYIIDQFPAEKAIAQLEQEFEDNGLKVAIIGAGPAGLSAAYYLVRLGYNVTVYESQNKAGGMIRYGVPYYRMPEDIMDDEVTVIEKMGVILKTGIKIGRDLLFEKLMHDNNAVLMATGFESPYELSIPGEHHSRVISGIDMLDDIANGKSVEVGNVVAVIGGGNVAFDAARTARRLGADVCIYYRRRIEDMPADSEEIHEAQAEGVKIIVQSIPVHIEDNNGSPRMIWNRAEMVDQGPGKRPKPVLIQGASETADVDTIITAIGQASDYDYIPESMSGRIHFNKTRVATERLGQTAETKVFAAGDIVNSRGDAISAIADGYRAAKGIDAYLTTKKGEK
ncbi:FAD-dependent oxidoreductase [bacterium]|nr:FAD-dependent oxidoreductase [bacterium]